MKEENKNLDGFFSTRLQNETIGDDGWNMPPDEIWDAAKPHFVNRKKKKRRFIFWLLIPVLAICIGVPIKLMEGSEVVQNMKGVDQFLQHDEKEIINAGKSIREATPIQKNVVQSLVEGSEKENVINGVSEKSIKKEIREKDSNAVKENNDQIVKRNQVITYARNENYEVENNATDISSNNTSQIRAKNNSHLKSENKREKILIPSLGKQSGLLDFLNDLHSIEDKKVEIESPVVSVDQSNFITPLAMPVYRNEVGISHSVLAINMIIAFGVIEENGLDKLDLSCSYFNANLSGRKWITNSFSISSGIQYSILDLDLDFSVYDTLDKEVLQFINEEFNDAKSRSTIGDGDSDIVIDLIDGVDVEIGDVLNVRGNVTQKISALQIPLFLDYHIYRKKWEHIFGTGVALEYIRVKEIPNEFSLYRQDEKISKPVEIPTIEMNFFGGSIYAKYGVRYLLNEQISFGLDAKFNLLSLPFSGIDMGFYYRWK